MPGKLERAVPRQRFTFSTPASGTGPEIILLREGDVLGTRELQLLIRIHATTTVTNTVLSIKARAVAPTADDPTTDFVFGTDLASQTIANGLTAGTFYLVPVDFSASVPGNLGSHIRIVLAATSTASAGNVDVTISIDLVHKS